MGMVPVRPGVLHFDVAYPERSSRLLLFVRWFLAIPHFIIVALFGPVLSVVGFLAWWAILITGQFPEGLWSLTMALLRWEARVQVYLYCLRDEYPPFGDEAYPIAFAMNRPARQSRLLIFVRWLLVIPHVFCLAFVGLAASVAFFLMWWGILFTGRPPRGLFDFIVGTYRWGARVAVYGAMLTDVYPPFSLE